MKRMENNKVVIAALMDDDLFGYISERISVKENVSMSNFSNMDIDEVRRLASGKAIDLAIIDFDIYKIESERSKLEELFTYGALDDKGSMTDFVMLYNDDNADELCELNETLLNRKIAMTNVSLDDKEDEIDKTIVVQCVHAAVGRLMNEKAYFIEMRKDMEDLLKNLTS